MKKSTHCVIEELNQLIPFLNSLEAVNDKIFFSPISEGKWSTAAIISHLMYWDRFILEERLEGMNNGELLPKSKVNVEDMNRLAEKYAHSGISKVQLIQEVCETRQRLLDSLVDKNLEIIFKIGSNEMTVNEYFKGMVEHDNHHIKQIKGLLCLRENKR
ncbi:DinB family protein [Bacillus cereus group sp. BfR-BA-01380]|uniref:DinB family protein n=1 Tax=Bacillus cereus group sp. BfR-BA-01380 TaxID=2920324 RepID=UPI001F5A0444|nr:DinB family protein [Bacillus cereus group sp. BfR-BA-01380]